MICSLSPIVLKVHKTYRQSNQVTWKETHGILQSENHFSTYSQSRQWCNTHDYSYCPLLCIFLEWTAGNDSLILVLVSI